MSLVLRIMVLPDRSDPSFWKARIVVLVDELNDGLTGVLDVYVGHCSRQASDFDEESQVFRSWVGRVTAVVRVCDFKIPKRKETGREEMECLRHG